MPIIYYDFDTFIYCRSQTYMQNNFLPGFLSRAKISSLSLCDTMPYFTALLQYSLRRKALMIDTCFGGYDI